MKVDEKFYSYEELERSVQRYGEETLQLFFFVKPIQCWLKNQTTEIIIDKEKMIYLNDLFKCIFKCIYHVKLFINITIFTLALLTVIDKKK